MNVFHLIPTDSGWQLHWEGHPEFLKLCDSPIKIEAEQEASDYLESLEESSILNLHFPDGTFELKRLHIGKGTKPNDGAG